MESIIFTLIPGGGTLECVVQGCTTGELAFNVGIDAFEFLVYPIKGIKIIGEGLGIFAPRIDDIVSGSKIDDVISIYNSHDIHHLFGRGGETPLLLLDKFGSPELALKELQKSVQYIANDNYQTGAWVTVIVDDIPVSVEGRVIDGIFRISSIAKRSF